ncbi:MAG: 2'-5' RNA ligase family protein [Xenococcaceae cyanobacterium MO_234.B1]|nr:2'-5' RNA ligase family protein [Xenococcaceae cyanobacterium MO_234.B1]
MSKNLFFIALLPPLAIQEEANKIQHHFAEVYNSKAALKSPPHITLQPPFYWEIDRLAELKTVLKEFIQKQAPIPIVLDGFAAFKPRVIYIDVIKTPELLALQKKLMLQLESALDIVHKAAKNRPFNPHLTVGFKDLTKANFYKAWDEFKEESFYYEFTASEFTLLQHNGKKWEIDSEFCLATGV